MSTRKKIKMPESFQNIPSAQSAWKHLFSLGIDFTEKQFESMKSYCMAVAMRDKAMEEWYSVGMPVTIEENGVMKQHPLLRAIRELNQQISRSLKDLGLIEKKTAEKKTNKSNLGMFD